MKPQQILIGALLLSAAGLGAFLAFGGGQENGNVLSGYIEGEPLYLASPVAGRLVALGVQRGDVVVAGATFFSVDPAQTQAARDQALAETEAAKSLAADAQRGQRPAELGVIEAQLATDDGQHPDRGEDLRNERQRRLVDLRCRLEDADQQPDTEHRQQHRCRDHQQQMQGLLSMGQYLLRIHRAAF